MDTNDLASDNRDASGNHSSIPLRKAISLSRLPTPQAPVRTRPSTPQPTKSPSGIPHVRSPLLGSNSLIPPPRTKRDSHLKASSQSSSSSSPSPTKTYENISFSYGTKAQAPAPPPLIGTSSSPPTTFSSPAFSSPPLGASTKPRSPLITQRQYSSGGISSAHTSSSSPTMSQRTPPAVMTKPQLGLTSPQRPPRERIRSHSPPETKSPPPRRRERARVKERTPSPPPAPPSRPPPPEPVITKVVRSEARQFVNPDVPGYVGFANLPNQVHRKSVKKGFEFTLMVVGESGLGKSTLVNSLFLTDLYPERQLADAAEKIKKTVKIDASTVEIEERGVKLRLTVVDTPGFADALNNGDCFKTIISYIDDQFERYLHDESGLNRRHIVDNRVHCCFYFVNPAGHGLKPLDISFMRAIHHKVNIVPVIAKADTLTKAEVLKMKKKILRQVDENGIQIYQLPDCDDDEDEDYKEQCRQLKEAVPFAVVGANQVIEVRGRKVRGRMYPWGVVEVENPEHCDFIKLRTMLITHMQDLQEVTQEIHYENFRSEKLATSDGVVRKPKTPRTSRIEAETKEAKLSEKEQALKEKEYELKRMQEMLAKMQAEMRQQQATTQRPKAEAPPPPSSRPPAVNGHSENMNNNSKQLNAQKA